jgi:hypothetical protein
MALKDIFLCKLGLYFSIEIIPEHTFPLQDGRDYPHVPCIILGSCRCH